MTSLNIAARLTETITVQRQTGHGSGGDPTYGTAFTMAARIERARSESADAEGRRANDQPDVYTVDALQLGDLVWYPEADTSDVDESRRVVGVALLKALDGTTTHYESRLS